MHERDIWRTASVMIKRYGDDASLHASLCADEMMAEGDMAGQRIWLRVLAAINDLAASAETGLMH